jgi:redox-sensitive bicupin YhaK (pirin superfamily)
MKPASYRDIPAADLTTFDLDTGGRIKLIAGSMEIGGRPVAGPINPRPGSMSTDPLFVDLTLGAGEQHRLPVKQGHNAFVYAYEGTVKIDGKTLPMQHAGILGDGGWVDFEGGPEGTRLVVIAGKPIGEPVVQYGPFVMNTREEIEQALDDYRQGKLTA